VRTYLSKTEYAYDTFRTLTGTDLDPSKHNEWKHVKVLQMGKKNCLVQCKYCDKQF